jgi:hypothetical protein
LFLLAFDRKEKSFFEKCKLIDFLKFYASFNVKNVLYILKRLEILRQVNDVAFEEDHRSALDGLIRAME